MQSKVESKSGIRKYLDRWWVEYGPQMPGVPIAISDSDLRLYAAMAQGSTYREHLEGVVL